MTSHTRCRSLAAWVVAALAAQRIGELVWSKRNERRLVDRGAVEYGRSHYPAMVALHVGWLASTLVEARRPSEVSTPARAVAFGVFVAVQPLRSWAIASLGDRWSTRVLVPPGEAPLVTGPYRYLSHPNYVAVVAELAALPLALGAWRTAAWASVANAVVLRARISVEEEALNEAHHQNPGGAVRQRAAQSSGR